MSPRGFLALACSIACTGLAAAAPAARAEVTAQGTAGSGATLESSAGTRHHITLGQSTGGGELTSSSGDIRLVAGLGSALLTTPVPEPGGPLLLASGAAWLALLGRLRLRRPGRRATVSGRHPGERT